MIDGHLWAHNVMLLLIFFSVVVFPYLTLHYQIDKVAVCYMIEPFFCCFYFTNKSIKHIFMWPFGAVLKLDNSPQWTTHKYKNFLHIFMWFVMKIFNSYLIFMYGQESSDFWNRDYIFFSIKNRKVMKRKERYFQGYLMYKMYYDVDT